MFYYKLRYFLYGQYTIAIFLFSNHIEKTTWPLSENHFDAAAYSEMSTETSKSISTAQAHRRSDLPMDEIETTSNSLKSLIKDLGAFSSVTKFAFEEFDWSAGKLNDRLSQLRDLILGRCLMGISQYEDILDQLTFAEHMFDTMIECVQVIRHSRIEGEVASTCIRLMATLRVRLLTFYDLAGHPDSKRLNYAFELSQLEDLYDILTSRFDNIASIAFSTKTSFEKHSRTVKNTLTVLKSYALEKKR